MRRLPKLVGAFSAVFFSLPLLALAQQTPRFDTIVKTVLGLLNNIAILLVGVAAFLLAYGIFRYIGAGADPKRRFEGGQLIMWGLLSLFVMISFWGIVNVLLGSFFSPQSLQGFQLNGQLWKQ